MRFLLLALSTSVAFLWACNASQPQQSDTVAEDGQSLLWRIEGEELEEPSYLYGTIHLIKEEDFVFGEHLKKTLMEAEKLALEIPLDEEAMMGAAMGLMYKGDTTLSDFVSPEQMDTLSTFFRDTIGLSKMEWMSYQKMKPFALSQVFLTNMLGEMPMSFELEFKKIADSLEIPIVGLETIEDQLAVINGMPMESQIEMVMTSVRDYQETTEEFDKLIRFYKEQKLDSLHHLMASEYDDILEFSESFLDQRNRNWIPKIEELIKAQTTFIAVGAGHLLGDQGVIKLLEAEGYTLTPIETE